MALETFTYAPRVNPVGDHSFRIREVQFGDGYKQSVGDGLNTELQSWSLTFIGNWQRITEIRNFFKRHGGYKAFKWTTPNFDVGLFTCNKYQVTALGKNARKDHMYQLTATFEIAFKP